MAPPGPKRFKPGHIEILSKGGAGTAASRSFGPKLPPLRSRPPAWLGGTLLALTLLAGGRVAGDILTPAVAATVVRYEGDVAWVKRPELDTPFGPVHLEGHPPVFAPVEVSMVTWSGPMYYTNASRTRLFLLPGLVVMGLGLAGVAMLVASLWK